MRWFRGYAASLCIDGVVRMLMAAPLVYLASERLAAVAVVGAGVIGIGAPLAARAGDLRGLLRGVTAAPFPIRAAVVFAAPASIISLVDQTLVNGGPLLVAAGGGRHATTAAGLVFAATMIVRAPVYVFQGLGASLLANLTHLNATADSARMRAAVTRIAAIMLVAGAVTARTAVAIGPAALRDALRAGVYRRPDAARRRSARASASTWPPRPFRRRCSRRPRRPREPGLAGSLGVFLAVTRRPGRPLSRIGAAFLAAAVTNFVRSPRPPRGLTGRRHPRAG